MKTLKFLLAAIFYYSLTFIHLSITFWTNTFDTIYRTHTMWGPGITIFSIVTQSLLLYYSDLYRTLFIYWYLIAWLTYIFIPKLRAYHDASAAMIKEIQQ